MKYTFASLFPGTTSAVDIATVPLQFHARQLDVVSKDRAYYFQAKGIQVTQADALRSMLRNPVVKEGFRKMAASAALDRIIESPERPEGLILQGGTPIHLDIPEIHVNSVISAIIIDEISDLFFEIWHHSFEMAKIRRNTSDYNVIIYQNDVLAHLRFETKK